MNLQRCLYALLERGALDWVYAGEVASVAKFTGGANTEDEIREISFVLTREVVQQGLMEIGDLLGEGGRFRKWDVSDQEALERVEREWIALGRNPSLGEICWLQNTCKGNEIGKSLLDLWNHPRLSAETLIMRSRVFGWVDLEWVDWLVERVGGATPQTSGDASIKIIRQVVQPRLMEIGDLRKGGFHKWDLPIQECLDRVEREWKALGRNPMLGEICWLQNTAQGNALGEHLLGQRRMPPLRLSGMPYSTPTGE